MTAPRGRFRIEDYIKEMALLDRLTTQDRAGIDIVLPSWNDAVALEARLKRVILQTSILYGELSKPSPFAEVMTTVVRPSILKLRIGDQTDQMLIIPVNSQPGDTER
jgi:hypothetical protein